MTTIITERLQKYSIQSAEAEKDALKEILQAIILYGLSGTEFFEEALFQGGTALRILHNLQRFSEDLDFILKKPNPDFKWQPFLRAIEDVCKEFGIVSEVIDKSKSDHTVQKMILKDNSIVKFLNLSFHHHFEKKLTIKLKIDTNPPAGSTSEIKFLDFPLAFMVEAQDLPSNFAGKSHALLCRKYMKGRDWYDFLWYVSKEISPNFVFLSNAINQQGPWAGQNIQVTGQWYLAALQEKIKIIDWEKAADEVAPFLNKSDRTTLKLWGKPFFQDRLEKLNRILQSHSS